MSQVVPSNGTFGDGGGTLTDEQYWSPLPAHTVMTTWPLARPVAHILDRVRRLAERIRAVDGRSDLSGLDAVAELAEMQIADESLVANITDML